MTIDGINTKLEVNGVDMTGGIDFGTDPATFTFVEEVLQVTKENYERLLEMAHERRNFKDKIPPRPFIEAERGETRLSPRILRADEVEVRLKEPPELPGGQS